MGEVVFELAKWLLWIEFYGRDDTVERTIELLRALRRRQAQRLRDRLNGGSGRGVLPGRADRRGCGGSIRPNPRSCSAGSARGGTGAITGGRSRSHRSWRRDRPGEIAHGGEDITVLLIVYLFRCPRTTRLPAEIELTDRRFAKSNRMQLRDGVYPIVRFARRLLNHLWGHHGSGRIHRDILAGVGRWREPAEPVQEDPPRPGASSTDGTGHIVPGRLLPVQDEPGDPRRLRGRFREQSRLRVV